MFNIPLIKRRAAQETIPIQILGREIKMVVGLGNPGERYENSYHNAGFLFLDYLINHYSENEADETRKLKRIKSFTYIRLGGLIFAKSDTFMNNSGKAVKELLRYFNILPKELLVVHDDSDISFGEYKLSFSRGSAGHNGIESIMKSIGTEEFLRLRIGVRKTNKKAGDFVLSKIPKDELDDLANLFAKIEASHFKA